MAHTYSEDEHFESYAKRAQKASDMKMLARLREKHGAHGGYGGEKSPPEASTEMLEEAPEADGSVDPETGDSPRPSDENGPHPDGCRCPDCKAWMAKKKGGHDLTDDDAALLLHMP